MELLNPQAWSVDTPRRGELKADDAAIPPEWLRKGVRIEQELSVRPRPGQPDVPPLRLAVEPRSDERSLLVVRFPSGAIEFCLPEEGGPEAMHRRGENWTRELFRVELPSSSPLRRGVVSQALRLVLLRLSGRLVDSLARRGLPVAARCAESWLWRRAGLREGWHRVRWEAGALQLEPAVPQASAGRALLLVHGTFSSTRASFGGVLQPEVLENLERLYPGGIFGFEHFSFSRSLEQNLEHLAGGLAGAERPRNASTKEIGDTAAASAGESRPQLLEADVVAFSRGGLLARMLLEQRLVKCRRLLLCATPNSGTPLARGERWRESLGWLANLLECCPDHPLIDGTELIVQGLLWLATRLTSDLPGLADMRPDSQLLGRLAETAPDAEACFALAAQYQPNGNPLQRLLDLGSDRFFTQPNDLVVPTRGVWELGVSNHRLPDESIACFGPGGNLRQAEGDVQHLNLLRQQESREWIQRVLSGEPQGLPLFCRSEFDHEFPRRGPEHRAVETTGQRSLVGPANPGSLRQPRSESLRAGDRSLQIMILGRPETLAGSGASLGHGRSGLKERRRSGEALILATYGGARVFQPFALSGRQGDTLAGRRFQRIISIHEKINDRLAGRRQRLPSARELRELGANLFATLFSGPISHLYDVARTEQGSERLNIIITCSIPWLAGKPWELAWDPLRRKFLATEDVHVVRSVFTAVPAERPPREQRPLRILIVEAQPADAAVLSIEVERKRILHRFRDLVAAGAAELSVLVAARPESLHERLVESSLRGRPFDIVHFIGHGDFDSRAREGCLLFVDGERGESVAVGVQTLRELLCNRGLQLVFLNACDTARQPGARDRGLAQSLVEAGLPAVVANQFPVLDPSAVAFAERFYWGLAQGSSLGAAAREARIAVNYSAGREAIDWAVPVLYARDPDDVLCRPPARPLEPLVGKQPVAKAPLAPRKVRPARVGVADLSRDIVELAEVLRRMNAAQDYFEFRPVQVSVPLDVWRRERDRASGRERTFLVADELAESLRDEVERIGVDYLACVTNWWVSESAGGDQNLLGWWSDDRNCPVFVLSIAGLELHDSVHDHTERLSFTQRVLINEFVVCCGGFLHDAHSQDGYGIMQVAGPVDELFRYDPARNPGTIVSPLRIHEPQRTRLLSTIPRQFQPTRFLAACERLLASE